MHLIFTLWRTWDTVGPDLWDPGSPAPLPRNSPDQRSHPGHQTWRNMRGLKGAHWITSDERVRYSPQICCCYSRHQEPKSCEAIGPALILALQHTKLVSSTGGEQETLLPWPPTTSSGTCKEKPSPHVISCSHIKQAVLGESNSMILCR